MHKRGKVTAADVASIVGVSQSTVSRVLNDVDTSFISEKTIQRVREVAAELGYSPNPIARALRLQQTNLLGLIVREIADPFFAEFIGTLSSQTRALGYHVILGHAHSDPEEGLTVHSALDTGHCDGVFILGDLRDDEQALLQMLKGQRAIVALCRGESPASIATVNTDNRAGVRLVLDHLYDLGHRRIAFIDGGWLGDIRERREAFLTYLAERGLPVGEAVVRTEANNADAGYRAMQQLLSVDPRPTAIVASDDSLAIGVLKAAADAGIRVPEDISVAGFDDISVSRYLSPSLTTVRQLIDQMSAHAISMMFELIQGKEISEQDRLVQLAPELVVRQSTGRASVR